LTPVAAATPAARERIRQIVEAAAAVMGRQGFAETSIKDIAAAAGIAGGLVHYYFESKEDLLSAVVRAHCDDMLEASRAAFVDDGTPPLNRVAVGLQRSLEHCAASPEGWRLFFEMVALSGHNPRVRQTLMDLYREVGAVTEEIAADINSQLPTPMPVPVRDFASVVTATLDGLAIRMVVDPEFDHQAAYRALAFLLVASGAASYHQAGVEIPVEEILRSIGVDVTAVET
jgi:AcrR family transcriptional regulator